MSITGNTVSHPMLQTSAMIKCDMPVNFDEVFGLQFACMYQNLFYSFPDTA